MISLNLGMKLVKVVIENISLPAEVEKALDEKTRLGMLEEHLDTYTRLKAADALADAAKNEGGGLAGMGVALGAGATLGKVFAGNIQETQTPVKKSGKKCSKCGSAIPANAKFCPGCGGKLKTTKNVFCQECGSELSANAKFCSECGHKVGE